MNKNISGAKEGLVSEVREGLIRLITLSFESIFHYVLIYI